MSGEEIFSKHHTRWDPWGCRGCKAVRSKWHTTYMRYACRISVVQYEVYITRLDLMDYEYSPSEDLSPCADGQKHQRVTLNDYVEVF